MQSYKRLMLMVVLAIGLLLAGFGVSSPAATPTPVGVSLLQFGCTPPENGDGSVIGPATVTVTAFGSCNERISNATLAPGGKLYHLRLTAGASTVDGSTPHVTFTVYDGLTATPITCTTALTPTFTCNDPTHQYVVKSGDQIQILATVPDSNTSLSSVSATIEESIYQ